MSLVRRFLGGLPAVALLAVASIAVGVLLQTSDTAKAQVTSPSQTCRASIIIDRSGSVGTNMVTLKEQIRRLFQPTGLYDAKIEIAFWSFSNGAGNVNYNAPFYGYVNTRGEDSRFMAALSAVQPQGDTNYQQAFAYHGTTRNAALNDIIEKADILVFMTDGQPNAADRAGVNPEQAGRDAAQKHIDAGRVVIGGSIGANAAQVRVINYVVSNNREDNRNTFTASTNYNDLALKLRERINTKCKELFPPEPCPYNAGLPKDDPSCQPPATPAYNLVPYVSADNTVISSDESAAFRYRITNESSNVTTGPITWTVKQIVVDKDQSADPLLWPEAFRDGYNCQKLLSLVGNKGACNESVSTGTKQFAPGGTTLIEFETGGASRVEINDAWPVGTKVCYVLSIAKPTEKDAPTDRTTKAACVVIGKRPTVQIWGGDVNVGGSMAGDSEAVPTTLPKIQTGLTAKSSPVNRMFGSWAEYAASATGAIIGLGTAAELEGGYPGTMTSQQRVWSELTFANKNDAFGAFAPSRTIPNLANALMANQPVTPIVADKLNPDSLPSGVHEKRTPGGLTLAAGVLSKAKSIVIHVPNETVTIEGDLAYTPDPLTSIDEIPRLVIVARAINIQGNVGNIDAWLIARNSPNGSGGGTITTCSDGPDALTINDCAQPLRINGAVMARQLLLKRTAGAGAGEESDRPGEIINLRADAYLSSLARRTKSSVPITSYSVELPPRF